MKQILFLFFFMMAPLSWSSVIPNHSVPVINDSVFVAGKSWVWKYYQDGKIYSTEKYTVLESSPERVVFQMSTKLPEQTAFVVHHRLEADPRRCLRAYQNPADFRPWSFKLYYWRDNQWNLVEGLENTLAFEEKFNCDGHIYQSPAKTTVFESFETDLGTQFLFQQRRGTQDNRSWYFYGTEHAGVMAYKKMSRPDQAIQYYIRYSATE